MSDDGSFVKEDGVVAQMRPGALGQLPTKKPCIECPLRKDAKPGALGGYSPRDYLRIMGGPADIGCHASKGFDAQDHARTRSCTGVAAFRASMGVLAPHPLSHAHEATKYIGNDPEQIAVGMCFDDPIEFVLHHACQEGVDAHWNVCPNGMDPEEWGRKHGRR